MSVSFLCSYPFPNYGSFTKSPEATAWNRTHSLNLEVKGREKSLARGKSTQPPGPGAQLTSQPPRCLHAFPCQLHRKELQSQLKHQQERAMKRRHRGTAAVTVSWASTIKLALAQPHRKQLFLIVFLRSSSWSCVFSYLNRLLKMNTEEISSDRSRC